MKRLLTGLVAGFCLATTATGLAASEWSQHGNGIWCKTTAGGVACVRESGTGYGVGIHRRYVIVLDLDTGRTVFKRYQP